MSGIVGVFDRGGGVVSPEDVHDLCARLAHRGPDGSDTWLEGRVGLGHQHLIATPEAHRERWPHVSGDLVVTADARLDNRRELRESLSLSPSEPLTESELLAAAYREWGERCPEHLLGAFAFAIWDGARDRLFCARDHVGVKPFYYTASEEAFACASEQKALLAHPSVSPAVDDLRVADFLCGLHEDTERTFYDAVRRLPPAHALSVDADGLERWRYWDLDPTRTITLASDAAYERRFRELFEEAVRCRFRSPGPVGAALSGGLDSSSITVVARDLLPADQPLYTFSNVFDDAPSSDEREFIESVVDREGIVSQYLFADDVSVLVDRERVFDHYDQPPHNTLHFARWEKAKHVREAGVNVVLCGALGDSAVNYGLELLPHLLRTGRWRHLHRELTAMADILDAPARHLFVRHALKPMVPDALLRRRTRARGQPVLTDAENPTLDDAFVSRLGLDERVAQARDSPSALRQRARTWQYDSLTGGRVCASLETSDVANAAFGVEQRYPFTDVRLLEFSLAIPRSQQLNDGWTRSIIRRSLDGLLPETVQWRPWKTAMNEGFWNALAKEDDRLRTLADDPGPLTAYLDEAELRAAYERFTDEPTSRDARSLWRALSLSAWYDETVADAREPPAADPPDTFH
ncbi:asparagine synthase-related protein [Natronobiforma cellulositropha]|uniref:asparagine synthase-related protein n=1 Tax=Natronobiforma cellulositropha TaxID=1679076 RepID=UPI0021D57BB4|nr:asparagine synthase-related protein [Natronobiforma cellulositropha]